MYCNGNVLTTFYLFLFGLFGDQRQEDALIEEAGATSKEDEDEPE